MKVYDAGMGNFLVFVLRNPVLNLLTEHQSYTVYIFLLDMVENDEIDEYGAAPQENSEDEEIGINK